MFAADVKGCVGCAEASIGGRKIDDAPAVLRQHHAHLMLHAEQGPEHVSIEGCRVGLGGLLRDGPPLPSVAGVVDGNVQTAEALQRLIDQVADIVFMAHVGAPILRLRAEPAKFSDELLTGFVAASGHHDAAPSRAKAIAVARPMPVRAPVINTTGGVHQQLDGAKQPKTVWVAAEFELQAVGIGEIDRAVSGRGWILSRRVEEGLPSVPALFTLTSSTTKALKLLDRSGFAHRLRGASARPLPQIPPPASSKFGQFEELPSRPALRRRRPAQTRAAPAPSWMSTAAPRPIPGTGPAISPPVPRPCTSFALSPLSFFPVRPTIDGDDVS